MITGFLSYLTGIINGSFNLMGNLAIADTGFTVLAVFLVSVFVGLSMELVER